MAARDRARVTPPARFRLAELFAQPGLVVWCLYLILTPFYVVDSGLPQPGDALVFPLLPLALSRWDGKLDRTTSKMLRALLWFTIWVFVVNYAWAFIQWKWTKPEDFIIHPLFYAYNAAVLLAALILAKREPARFLRLTFDVMFWMIMFQVVASFFYRTDLYRGTLFFNSPNQLGYYSLLAACLFAMIQQPLGLSRLQASVGVTGCAYLAVLSSSRASLAGILILLLVLLVSNPRAIIAGSLLAFGLTFLGGPLSDAMEFTQYRALENREPEVSFAEERGYDRIWQSPEYLLTGAGEGDYARFGNPNQPAREIHSSLGTVVFGYGIVGVILFGLFAVRLVRGGALRTTIILIPATIYTVAHQGLRFTMFWVVIAVFVVLKQIEGRRPP
ncbi:MAG: hypothetical protein IPQ07_33970 [Myxococcales bacterium]|nr:hypothetical protein [Myxococcales bacterium]